MPKPGKVIAASREIHGVIAKLLTENGGKIAAKSGGVAGTAMNSAHGDVITFVAAQAEFTVDVMSRGSKITPAQLSVALATKGLSITGLSDNEYVKCAGSLASVAAQLSAASSLTISTAGAAIVPAILLLSDTYMLVQSCTPAASKAMDDIDRAVDEVTEDVTKYDWSDKGMMEWAGQGFPGLLR